MDYIMTITGGVSVVVDKNHPGSQGGVDHQGYENGHAIKINDTYHLLITELFDNRWHPETVGSVPARIGYWTSTDGDHWTRESTIVTGTASGRPDDYNDLKNNTWSASWNWNEEDNRWNIFWRGGTIFRYESTAEGFDGLAGPYAEAEGSPIFLQGAPQQWDNGTPDSFGNIYRGTDGRFYSFVGVGQIESDDPQWVNGLAWAEHRKGPWTRVNTDGNPTFVYSENPYVYQYGNSLGENVYFCVYDDLSNQHSLGYGYSVDGVHWVGKTLDLTGHMNWACNNDFLSSARTPCCFIQEENGTYTILLTARAEESNFFNIARLNVKMEEVQTPAEKGILLPGDMRDWKSVSGSIEVQYGREYSLDGRKDDGNSVYTAGTYHDVMIEATLRYVDQTWNYGSGKAGVYARKTNIDEKDGGYHAYLTANNKVQLYAGSNLLAETDIGKRPAIFRKLRMTVIRDNIKVYYNGASEPCIDVTDNTYINAGYIGLEAIKSHWHYEKVAVIDVTALP